MQWMNEWKKWMKDFIKVSIVFSLNKIIGDTIYNIMKA